MADREQWIAGLHVFAHLQHVLARRDSAHDFDLGVGGLLRAFDHDDSISAVRQHAARVNDHRFATIDRSGGRRSHRAFANYGEIGGQRFRRAKSIDGAHGITIHRAAWKGGQGS